MEVYQPTVTRDANPQNSYYTVEFGAERCYEKFKRRKLHSKSSSRERRRKEIFEEEKYCA
uniref:Uncharacterized protein n=1 Tax=Salix viminalis TaxID=40686 RepID=A0A6N2KQF9_SALVM